MTRYELAIEELRTTPRTWLITGAAGFIGSNLLERLLALGQRVVGLDNFSTGHRENLDEVLGRVDGAQPKLRFIEGDTRDLATCRDACADVDYVLHQAALGSVPRSIDDPLRSHASNVDGFINMLVAARDAGARRFVYASSSATYGDNADLPKREESIGRQLSPYAATKRINEIYADVFQRVYGLQSVGLRYFNVFGSRQDPHGPYAAVIPRWVAAMLDDEACVIHGDGLTSRDFCYVDNVVQANILAAMGPDTDASAVYNVACGERTTLIDLFHLIRAGLAPYHPNVAHGTPLYDGFRKGDVRHTLADISLITERLGYAPTHSIAQGMEAALGWYVANAGSGAARARAGAPTPALGPALSAPLAL